MKNSDTWMVDYLHALQEQRFCGDLSLKFEGGKVTLFRREETMKPNDLLWRNTEHNGDDHSY